MLEVFTERKKESTLEFVELYLYGKVIFKIQSAEFLCNV